MKKIIFWLVGLLFLNNVSADNINESNFLEFLSNKKFISAEFLQTTFKDGQVRKIKGEIKANRRGMFKVVYQEPLNEIISSNGNQIYRLDKEIEQLDISEIDTTLSESPIGIFSTSKEELEDLFAVTNCLIDEELVTCFLEPKLEGSFLKNVSIQLANDELTSLAYIDTFDQKVTLDFVDLSWDKILDKEFILEIPEGIDVVNH